MLLMCFSAAPSVIPRAAGDPDVRPALGHGAQHLPLAGRQRREPVVPPAPDHQLGHDLRVERGPAAGDPAQARSMNSRTSATRSLSR